MAKKRAPALLSEKSNKLWRETLAVYDLAEHEYPILEAACREMDLVDQLEKELRDSSMVVPGSMGQPSANPLLAEVRLHRTAYQQAIKALGLPDADVDEVPNARRSAAQKAAQARWSRGA